MRREIKLEPGQQRIKIYEALQKVLEGAHFEKYVDVYVEVQTDDAGVEFHPDGGKIVAKEWDQGQQYMHGQAINFSSFCAATGIKPRNPALPWIFDYDASNPTHNITYDISVGEFQQFASQFEIEVSQNKGVAPTRNVCPSRYRAPLTDDMQPHLNKTFRELSQDLAERVAQAFRGALLDRRDADLIWDELTPELRNRALMAADDSALLVNRGSQEERERREEGRYKLEEAAKLIASSGECSEEQILERLCAASQDDSLPTYMPFMKVRNTYRNKSSRFPVVVNKDVASSYAAFLNSSG